MRTQTLSHAPARSIGFKNPFTWSNLAKFYSRALPSSFGFNRATVQDAKFITQGFAMVAGIGVFLVFFLPLLLFIFQ